MNDGTTYSIVIWLEFFDLWRINRKIDAMSSEGFELIEVIPPGFPGPQKLSLKFSKVNEPEVSRAHFKLFWQQVKFEYEWSFKETLGTFYITKTKP